MINIKDYESNFIIFHSEKECYKNPAILDELTGVYSREYFMAAAPLLLDNARIRQEDAYLTIIDLDNFKQLNDTYGNDAGDIVLKTTAEIIRHILRCSDFFARFGPDEFILILTGVNESMARELIERIRLSIVGVLIELETANTSITAGFGTAVVKPGDSFDTAIERAGTALSKAKETGSDKTVFIKP